MAAGRSGQGRRGERGGLGGLGGGGRTLVGSGGMLRSHVAPDDRAVPDRSADEPVVEFANWPLYIDVAGGDRPTLREFSRRTGIAVRYTEEINGDDEFFGSIGPRLAMGQPVGRDLIVPSDWVTARFVALGWVQELDHSRLPHVLPGLDPLLRRPPFDPGRRFSVPWQSGITGIAYNRKRLGREIRSVAELWAEDLHGQVTLFGSLDEAVPLLLMARGADPRAFTADDFHGVVDEVRARVLDGHLRRFTGNDYTDDLVAGEVLACQAWSGDVVQLQTETDGIEFVIPEEGGELWSDNLVVPNRAGHKANAERLVDYYYEPETAAALARHVHYVCPVPAARDVLASSSDRATAALAEDPLIFPTDELRARLTSMRDVPEEYRPEFEEAWNAVVGF